MSQLTFDAAAAKSMEAIYTTPDVVAQRARVLDLLAPTPGERVLDVGVGPGLLALDLARLVGESGRLVGLDLAPAMVAISTARLAELPQAEIRLATRPIWNCRMPASTPRSRPRCMSMSPTCRGPCPNCIGCCVPAAGR